jgi:hypothetical protein
MRRGLLALGVIILCLRAFADAPASAPTTEPTKTGEFDITFTERSPLSAPREIARRMNLREHDLGADYDLTKMPFKAYVPKSYDAAQPHGLIVFLGYKDSVSVATLWEPALDQSHLIFITPVAHSGRQYQPVIPIWQTMGLAFDAVDNLKKAYNIDPKRIYLVGFDNTAQHSFACADVFDGFVICQDYAYFVKLTQSNGTFFTPQFGPPGGPIFAMAKQRPYVLAAGDIDSKDSMDGLMAASLRQLGFANVTTIKTDGEDLHYPNLQLKWFQETALPYLDKIAATQNIKPLPVAAATPHPTTQRIAATTPSNESEPQHLLKVAKLYMDNGQTNLAKSKLQLIIDKYPDDPAAKTAKQWLDQLPTE